MMLQSEHRNVRYVALGYCIENTVVNAAHNVREERLTEIASDLLA